MSSESKINSRISLLINFIDYLEKEKMEYCLLGNIERTLLDQEQSQQMYEQNYTDFDFYININKKKLIINFVQNFCEKNDLKLINAVQYEINSYGFIICYRNIYKNYESVLIDICDEYIHLNRRIYQFKSENIKIMKINENIDLKTLIPESALIYYLLKKILKQQIQDNDLNYIFKLFKRISILESIDLEKYFNDATTKEVIDALQNENFIFFKQRLSFLRSQIIKKKPIKLIDCFKLIKRYFLRFFYTTGTFIIFLGCDGAGKTSVNQKSFKTFERISFGRHYKYFHFIPLSIYQKKTHEIHFPSKDPPYNFIISFTKIIYLYLINLFGYIFNIKFLLARSTTVAIDRYFYDILVDPERYKIKLPEKIIKFFISIVPRPDLTFIITADPQKIYERKKEIQEDKIQEIQNKYLELKKIIKNSYIIDNSKDLQKCVTNVQDITVNFMDKKMKE